MYVENQNIIALELDRSGQQNMFTLYSGTAIQKYEFDKTSKELLILDNGELKLLKIR